MKRWGYWGAILVSIYIIVFDVWASVAVQSTAAMGLVVPALLILYLYSKRSPFL